MARERIDRCLTRFKQSAPKQTPNIEPDSVAAARCEQLLQQLPASDGERKAFFRDHIRATRWQLARARLASAQTDAVAGWLAGAVIFPAGVFLRRAHCLLLDTIVGAGYLNHSSCPPDLLAWTDWSIAQSLADQDYLAAAVEFQLKALLLRTEGALLASPRLLRRAAEAVGHSLDLVATKIDRQANSAAADMLEHQGALLRYRTFAAPNEHAAQDIDVVQANTEFARALEVAARCSDPVIQLDTHYLKAMDAYRRGEFDEADEHNQAAGRVAKTLDALSPFTPDRLLAMELLIAQRLEQPERIRELEQKCREAYEQRPVRYFREVFSRACGRELPHRAMHRERVACRTALFFRRDEFLMLPLD